MDTKLNVLVVDDEQIVLDSVKRHLRNDDVNILTALRVSEGQEIMKKETVDIILTDLMMPDIDGLEFMKIVGKEHPNLPMIMITGYATISTALQATQLGAFDYIAKPFTKTELRSVVKRAIDLVRVSDKAEDSSEKIVLSEKDKALRTIGEYSWVMTQKDGTVLVGVERKFLHVMGKVQTVYLPAEGEKIRQGAVFFQLFSSDMRSHALLAPFSGEVVKVNQEVIDYPNKALQDPYGDGWLITIDPSNFEEERKLLGI